MLPVIYGVLAFYCTPCWQGKTVFSHSCWTVCLTRREEASKLLNQSNVPSEMEL